MNIVKGKDESKRKWFRVARTTQNAPLLLFATFLTVASLVFLVVSDVLHESTTRFPLTLAVCTGVAFGALSTGIVFVIGRRGYPGKFRFYQPFVGGDTFTAMQVLGYLSFGCSALISVVCIRIYEVPGETASSQSTPPVRGVLTTAGILLFFANTILLASLDHFETSQRTSANTSTSTVGLSQLSFLRSSSNRSTVVALIMTTLGNIVPPIASLMYPFLTDIAFAVQLTLHVASAALVHLYIGWVCTPRYRLFMPFPQGSLKVGFTQAFAWFCFGVALQGSIFMIRAGAVPPYVIAGVCSLSFVSILSLLLFVRILPFHKQITEGPSSAFVVRHGRFTMSAVATLDAVFITAVSLALMHPDILGTLFGLYHVSAEIRAGLEVCQCVSAAFLLTLPPLTHSVGAAVFPNVFDLWAPFTGNKEFIALQALGWASYTTSLMVGVIAFSMGPGAVILFTAFALFAQLLIHASLHVFQPMHCASPRSPVSPRSPQYRGRFFTDAASSLHNGSTGTALNGELLLSVVITASGVSMRVLADAAELGGAPVQNTLLWFSFATFVVSTPIAHGSMRTRGARVLSPFEGPAEYVALQAVGWTLYALFLLVSGISLAEGKPLFGSLSWSAESLLQLIPFSMIVFSAFVWRADEFTAMSASDATQLASSDARSSVEVAGELLQLLQGRERAQCPSGLLKELKTFLETERKTSQMPTHRPSPFEVANANEVSAKSERKAHSIANVSVGTLCIAELFLYLLAGYFSAQRARQASAVVLAVSGAICSSLTCGGVHAIYGPLAHSAYRVFMPFSGGARFVVLQATGWGAYSASLVLCMAFLLGTDSEEFAVVLVFAGVLGAAAQLLILRSVALFTTSSSGTSFFEAHAEGSVAALLFLATFTFQHIVQHSGAVNHDMLSPIALVVSSTSILLALPLGAIALSKQHGRTAEDAERLADAALDATPKKRRPQRAAELPISQHVQPFSVEYLLIPMSVVPVAVIYVMYFVVHRYTEYAATMQLVLHYAFYATMCFVFVTIGSHSRSTAGLLPSWLIDARATVTTCLLYMIPTCIVLPSYIMPLAFPCRGTFLWAAVITCITIIPPPYNRKIVRAAMAIYVGYWLYELVVGENPFYLALGGSTGRSLLWHPISSLCIVFDAAVPVFWFFYTFSYSGFPEEHGYRRSKRFLAFFKRHFFDDAVRYFNLRVSAEPAIRGKLNSESEQFLFGFHPHGVFPATAMYLAETDVWRETIGHNNKRCVSVHGATILFNGPLLRDFVMGIGGRSVTRQGIENSLSEGNSVVIVPGGQAELVVTQCSTSELHIVTHHLGMIRLAIRHNVPLVPILVLNENNILENVRWYKTQRWTLKFLGFPFPLVPIGRWGLPVPNRVELLAAVGNPVYPFEKGAEPNANLAADKAYVDSVAGRYFEELRRLFESKKREVSGLQDMKLFLHHGLPHADPRQSSKEKSTVKKN